MMTVLVEDSGEVKRLTLNQEEDLIHDPTLITGGRSHLNLHQQRLELLTEKADGEEVLFEMRNHVDGPRRLGEHGEIMIANTMMKTTGTVVVVIDTDLSTGIAATMKTTFQSGVMMSLLEVHHWVHLTPLVHSDQGLRRRKLL
jgi:hypothetical protein